MLSELAVLRFGLGARPGELAAAGGDPRGWLKHQIRGSVPLAVPATLAPSSEVYGDLLQARAEQREMKASGAQAVNAVKSAYQPHYRAQVLARTQSAALTDRPFAERLVHFWSNHFAVSSDKGVVYGLAGTLENEAIRPRVNGRFADLLLAVEQHPAMIVFLDNQGSTGRDSEAAQFAMRPAVQRRLEQNGQPARRPGINENLAREILELHTLGVNGGYTQADVTTFAEIITGWSIGGGKGRFAGGETGSFHFREGLHEPGPRIFMGRTYRQSGVQQGEAVLADLARHPATARFIATKLARHFIADDPPSAAVERITRTFLKSEGDLSKVYATLIDSAEAWEIRPGKFKTPEDFVFSALRALNVTPQQPEEVLRSFELLGQRQYTPGSPAGWPDTAGSWDSSDALMHRVLWSSKLAARSEQGLDPVDVAMNCLGACARPQTVQAIQRASSPSQALALLLMSPEFQRR